MSNHNPMNIATDFAKATGGTARKVVALTDKGPLNGFKKFLSRGSMIDMAVGVVMGSAVTAVVNSIVDNLISPLIGMIGGVPDLSGLLTITFNNSTVSFGAILNALINFLLVGVAVYFCVILPINSFVISLLPRMRLTLKNRGLALKSRLSPRCRRFATS